MTSDLSRRSFVGGTEPPTVSGAPGTGGNAPGVDLTVKPPDGKA